MEVVSILTYNLHKGFSLGNANFVLEHMCDAIEAVDADIVFLQEVQGQHLQYAQDIASWPEGTQADFIAGIRWPHVIYGKNAVYDDGHHGNAILSKFPIKCWDNINVSLSPTASRSLLHAEFEIPHLNQPLHAICIHLGLRKSERAGQLKSLEQRISETVPNNEPLIIAGDFNDWRGHAEYHLSDDLNLQEVFKIMDGQHAKTFPGWVPTLRVDRIYFRDLSPVACECLTQTPWRRLSDHVPLYAEFEVTTGD